MSRGPESRRFSPARHALLGWALGGAFLGAVLAAEGAVGSETRGIPIAGRVLSEDGGDPIAEVPVELWPLLGEYQEGARRLRGTETAEPTATAITDELGVFHLRAPAPGMWRVVMRPQGGVPMEHRVTPLTGPTGLQPCSLRSPLPMRVTVVDPRGRPVEGAEVRLELINGSGRCALPPAMARSGDRGVASLVARDVGFVVQVSVAAEGFPSLVRWVEPAGPVTLELAVPERRTLAVVDSAGRPLEGVLVSTTEGSVPLGLTGGDGLVELVLARGETAALRLLRPTGGGREVRVETVEDGRSRVELGPTPELAGRVIEQEARTPVDGAVVWAGSGAGDYVVSGPRGAFSLPVVEGDEPSSAAADGGGFSRDQVSLPKLAPGVLTPTFAVADASARIDGVVEDPAGRPVEGVTVSIDRGMARVYAYSDGAGRFSFDEVATGREIGLLGSLPGTLPERLGLLPTRASQPPLEPGERRRVVLVLERAITVTGRVVDEGREPIAGARVASRCCATSTGAEGRFDLRGQAPRGALEITAVGYASESLRVEQPDGGGGVVDLGDVVLAEGVGVEGWVLDEAGQPVAGADIWVEPAARRSGVRGLDERPGGDPDAATGEDGAFVITDRAAGEEILLEAWHRDFVGATLDGLEVPPEQAVVLTMERAAVVAGRVVDRSEEPVVATVSLRDPAATRSFPGRFAVSDVEGRFRLGSLEPGRYLLNALDVDERQRFAGEAFELAAGEQVERLIVVEPGAVVAGTVRDAAGDPVAGIQVQEVLEGRMLPLDVVSVPRRTTSDGDGRYALEGLLPGRVVVKAEGHGARGRAVGEIDAVPGLNRLDLVLEGRPGVEVSGLVLEPTGAPLAGAEVGLRFEGSGYGSKYGESAADGSFAFTRVGEGRWTLTARHPDFLASSDVVVVTDEPLYRELRLGAGGAIEGRVTGVADDGDAVRIEATRTADGARRRSGRGDWNVVSDNPPSYRFEKLAPGEWLVVARAESGRRGRGTGTVRAGEVASLDVELEPGLRLSGVALENGSPFAGGRLNALAESGVDDRSVLIDRLGRFEVVGLEAGRYQLQLSDVEGRRAHETEIDLEGDREVTLEWLTGPISGRVVDARDGLPVADAVVTIDSVDSSSRRSAERRSTGDDGRFVFAEVGEGVWSLAVEREGYLRSESRVERHGMEPAAELEIELQPAGGVVLEPVLPSGVPPPSIRVGVYVGDQLVNHEWIAAIVSGRARVRHVGADATTLRVIAPGGFVAVVDGVTAGLEPIRVPLELGADLRLVVPELVAEPVAAAVALIDPAGRRVPWAPPELVGGAVEARTLRPGAFGYAVETVDGRRWEGVVELTPGEDATITVD